MATLFETPAGLSLAPAVPASPQSRAVWMRIFGAWLVLVVMLLAVTGPSIATMRFGDPDDALRLLEVRDLLSGQSWFDLHQYRIAAPEGVAMHWSRLVDMPLAGMILLLRPLLGGSGAEMVAIVAVPLLTLLCTLILNGRLAGRLFDPETVAITCLITGTASPMLFQMTPLRIDHHGWQVVLALTALCGLGVRNPWRGGAIVGLSLAALLSISIEGLPLTAVFLGVCALRGLTDRHDRFAWLAAATSTLALAGIAVFLGTRGTADLVTHCDQISPVHLGLFAWVAAGVWGIRLAGPRPLPLQVAMLAGIAGGALAIMLGAAPECRGGAFVALDPLVRKYWYSGVSEGLPFWRSPLTYAVVTVFTPLFGLYACFEHWRRADSAEKRQWWITHGMVLAGAWVIGLMVARATATSCAIAAVPLGALVLRWIIALRKAPPGRRAMGYLGVVLVLMPAIPAVVWGAVQPAEKGETRNSVSMRQSKCRYDIAAKGLDRMAPTDIFAPLDIGPDLLVRSHHRVVATGHHRGSAGMHDVIAAFLDQPDAARPVIAKRHATVIALCPDIAEPWVYAHYAPNGLMARLLAGNAPEWLEPVNLAPGSHLKFWRVKG